MTKLISHIRNITEKSQENKSVNGNRFPFACHMNNLTGNIWCTLRKHQAVPLEKYVGHPITSSLDKNE